MGYTTDFSGSLTITPQPSPAQVAYLQAFATGRRMGRDPQKAAALPDPLREAVGLPLGEQAAYYVGNPTENDWGQRDDGTILDHNKPPTGQPGLWCQWTVENFGAEAGPDYRLVWDGGEKFYGYVAWLTYLIQHFYGPWGLQLSGEIEWAGEDSDDRGCIRVRENRISIGHPGPYIFEPETEPDVVRIEAIGEPR